MRVLLYHRLNIGDLVLATPAIQWFKAQHPEAEIRLVTNNWAAHLGRMLPGVSQVQIYNKFGATAKNEWHAILQARRWQPDLAIALSPSADKRLAYRLFWIGNAVGYADKSLVYKLAYRQRLTEPAGNLHVAEKLGRLFGITDYATLPAAKLEYKTDPAAPRFAVGMHLSARKPSNRPSLQQVVAIIDGIHRRLPGAAIALTSVSENRPNRAHISDTTFAENLKQAVGNKNVHFFDALNFAAIIDVHARCDSAIMPDGGLMHIAAALGKPVVGLFGNSDPADWRPFTPRSRYIQTESRCVADIAPDDILCAWEALI